MAVGAALSPGGHCTYRTWRTVGGLVIGGALVALVVLQSATSTNMYQRLPVPAKGRILHYVARHAAHPSVYVWWNWASGLTERGFLPVVGADHVYLYSVVAANSSGAASFDTYLINGWERGVDVHNNFTCCYYYKKNKTRSAMFLEKRLHIYKNSYLEARQWVCPNLTPNNLPKGISITPVTTKCPQDRGHYIPPAYPSRQRGPRFALCGKQVYSRKNPENLIEWFEYQLSLGVDKILMYPYKDLARGARSVLHYYRDRGLLELLPIDNLPELESHRRYWSVQSRIMGHDEQVMMFDAQARMAGYRYASVMDTDEYLVPADGSRSYGEYMEGLVARFPGGAAFQFLDQLHITSWGKTNNKSDIFVTQYTNRTESIDDAPKNMFLPDRVNAGSVSIHKSTPAKSYTWVRVPASLGVLHHYRSCRARWLVKTSQFAPNRCHGGFKRIKDKTLTSIMNTLQENIRSVRYKLNISVVP